MLDTNIVIAAITPAYPGLLRLLGTRSNAISVVTRIEVYGFHKLTTADRVRFDALFATFHEYAVTDAVVARAIALRQLRKMSLGDSLIAATALVHGHELLTSNLRDFTGIPGLRFSDPLAAGDPA